MDAEDIRLLYRLCGFTTVDEGLDLLERSLPLCDDSTKDANTSLPRSSESLRDSTD